MIRIIYTLIISLFLLLVSSTNIDAQVIINEFLPNSSQEWVEFFNSGVSVEDLSNYYFDDDTDFGSDSGSSAKIALSGLLQSQITCYLDLSTVLNNNGDHPTLFKIDGTTIDTYSYTTTTVDRSFSRVPDGGSWQVDQSPTKSLVRCSDSAPTPPPTAVPTQAPTNAPTATPTATPTKTATPQPTPAAAAGTAKPTKTSSPTPSPEILGEETTLELETPTSSPVVAEETKKKLPILPIVLISTGLLMIGFVVLQLIRASKNSAQT